MSCAGASSSSNVWAFSGAGASGGNPPGSVSALRLRKGHWDLVKDFPGSYVTGCNVLGAANVWVFGGAVAGLGAPIGTWHFRGSTWRRSNTGSVMLFNASAVSATDIWAVGADTTHSSRIQPVVARWNGRSWREIRFNGTALPQPTSTTTVGLDNIKATSPRSVWVLATVSRQSGTSFVVVHWNGQTWRRVRPGSADYYLPTAVPDGHGGWWSVPYRADQPVRYLLHRAHGRWTRFSLPVPLRVFPGDVSSSFGMIHVPHSDTMLVAGTQDLPPGGTGVILAFGRLAA